MSCPVSCLAVVTGRLAQIYHLYSLDYSSGTDRAGEAASGAVEAVLLYHVYLVFLPSLVDSMPMTSLACIVSVCRCLWRCL